MSDDSRVKVARDLTELAPMLASVGSETFDRFWSKVEFSDECWNWKAALARGGYGAFGVGKRRVVRAHRFVHQSLSDQLLTEGQDVDHRCGNRACVRPTHLQAVTRSENNQNRPGAQSNSKTGVRGVVWRAARKRFFVCAQHQGKYHSAGYFKTLEEAESAAINLRISLHSNNLKDRGLR